MIRTVIDILYLEIYLAASSSFFLRGVFKFSSPIVSSFKPFWAIRVFSPTAQTRALQPPDTTHVPEIRHISGLSAWLSMCKKSWLIEGDLRTKSRPPIDDSSTLILTCSLTRESAYIKQSAGMTSP